MTAAPLPASALPLAVLLLGVGGLCALLLLRRLRSDGAAAKRQRRLAEIAGDTPQLWKERQALRVARDELQSEKAAPWWRRAQWSRHIEAFLAPAGGSSAVPTVAAVTLAVVAAIAGALVQLFAMPFASATLLGLSAAPLAGYAAIRSLVARRRREFLETLPDAIDLIVRSVRAGIPVSAAITLAGQEVREPVRGEFKRLSDAISIGADLKEALERAAARVRLPDFDFFVVCLLIQRETGGQLAETLQNLSDILRRRKELRRKLKSLTAEGRASAKIVGSIPIVAGVGLFLLNPSYARRLLDDPVGNRLLMGAVVSLLLGMFVISRMTRSPE